MPKCVGIRRDMLDVVHGRRSARRPNGVIMRPAISSGRQAWLLPGNADDGDVDARKYVDRHAHRGASDDENEQGHHDNCMAG